MAEQYYHEVEVNSTIWLVIVLALALLPVAYWLGKKSVRVRPRRAFTGSRQTERPVDEPRFQPKKVMKLQKEFRCSLRPGRRRLSDSVITLSSTTWDIIVTAMITMVLAGTFASRHWNGLVQWAINGLAPSEAAVWGDLEAIFITSIASSIYFSLALFLRRLGEWNAVCRLIQQYRRIDVRPLIKEGYNLSFMLEHAKWAVGEKINARSTKAKRLQIEKKHLRDILEPEDEELWAMPDVRAI